MSWLMGIKANWSACVLPEGGFIRTSLFFIGPHATVRLPGFLRCGMEILQPAEPSPQSERSFISGYQVAILQRQRKHPFCGYSCIFNSV